MIRMPKIALVGVLALGLVGSVAVADYAIRGNSAAVRLDEGEHHPEIHRAIDALRNAREALKNADRDFDGHRTAAVGDVDNALAECQACLDVDKK